MKRALRKLSTSLLLGTFAAVVMFGAAVQAAQPPLVEARLVSDVKTVSPGSQFRVGVQFDIADGWHIYDKNPGDSGLPTTVNFSAPKGFRFDELQYPTAHEFRSAGDIVSRGFENKALLWTTVTAPASIPVGKAVVVKADADWLSCNDICVPGSQNVVLSLPIEESKAAFSTEARLFAAVHSHDHGHDHSHGATDAACCGTCGGGEKAAAKCCGTCGGSDKPAAKCCGTCGGGDKAAAKCCGTCGGGAKTAAKCCGKCGGSTAAKTSCGSDCAGCAAGKCGGDKAAAACCGKCGGAAAKKCGPDCAKCASGVCGAYSKIAFSLKDANGKTHSLADYKGKTVVLEWTNPTCPFVKAQYDTGKMQKVAASYAKKGVVWLTIDSSHFAKADGIKSWAKKNKVKQPVLLDPDGKVGRLYGAKTTPHVFVIDPKGEIVYKGAVDDNPLNKKDKTKSLVGPAIDATLKGKKVPTAETKSYGCGVKYKADGKAAPKAKSGKKRVRPAA